MTLEKTKVSQNESSICWKHPLQTHFSLKPVVLNKSNVMRFTSDKDLSSVDLVTTITALCHSE